MRRRERELTNINEIKEIVNTCKVCRIALLDEEGIYIVPLNFGYLLDGDRLELYFHSAAEGRKARILQNQSAAGFEMDCAHELVSGSTPCSYTYKYASIIGQGQICALTDPAEKIRAMELLMLHQSGSLFHFNEAMLQKVMMLRLTSQSFTAKGHR